MDIWRTSNFSKHHVKRTLLYILILIVLTSSTKRRINLFDEFSKMRDAFPHKNLVEINTLNYRVTYGNNCRLKQVNSDLEVPEIESEISGEIMTQSGIYKGTGHLFSFSQFNDSTLNIIIAVHGHYDTPEAILFMVNKKGNIVSEVLVSSVFIDGGTARVTRSLLNGRHNLSVVNKNLDERPAGEPCKAEVKHYLITGNGELELTHVESLEIECKQ
jgi:hypothetical protein